MNFKSVDAPLKPTRERYSALMDFLRERYLFWEAFGSLRRIRGRYFQSWKVVEFEPLVQP